MDMGRVMGLIDGWSQRGTGRVTDTSKGKKEHRKEMGLGVGAEQR